MAMDLTDFITGLPKVELHVHHVGSATPQTVARLAERYAGTTSVPADPALLAGYFTFTDFAHFIQVYLSVVDLIRDAEDVATLTYDIGAGLAAQSVRYAELTLTPYSSIVRGIPAEEYCEAVEDARLRAARDHSIQLRWCFDIPGEPTMTGADVTLDVALKQRPEGLVSFGLGGPEEGIARARYTAHFAAARAAGLHSVPHAGESTGPQTVWDAVRHLGAERIGHGIAAARDPKLMEHLREHDIALEVCPTSNACTRSVASLAEHPLPQLVAAGVPVTINSDDPPMFSTTLNREYQVAADLLDLDEHGVAELARQAVRFSFLDDPGKAAVLAEIDNYLKVFSNRAAAATSRIAGEPR
ncbi:adenosine deaminase [Micromonospora endolithica]|uniref:Adenosine deaminase n=1 Tax=Micromonospora endolithica TaxID=230091 RepID=A0A3A9Z0U3_9ACTN|nr:adenosine deaminase [Micromonospora endolithica]RKN41554.1 adenosine deaminase [Micromonospora endolithica]TWJ21880.1 adenosine deaminase/aminodeoxyfutalosine deaminase [Micromonospora endolithica]